MVAPKDAHSNDCDRDRIVRAQENSRVASCQEQQIVNGKAVKGIFGWRNFSCGPFSGGQSALRGKARAAPRREADDKNRSAFPERGR